MFHGFTHIVHRSWVTPNKQNSFAHYADAIKNQFHPLDRVSYGRVRFWCGCIVEERYILGFNGFNGCVRYNIWATKKDYLRVKPDSSPFPPPSRSVVGSENGKLRAEAMQTDKDDIRVKPRSINIASWMQTSMSNECSLRGFLYKSK